MAIEAERVVIALEAQTTQAQAAVRNFDKTFTTSMSDVERSANKAEASVQRSVNRIGTEVVKTTGQIKFATRDLGFQLSDIGVQMAGGTSPFLIIAQQGPQTLQAIQLITEAGASLGTVMKSLALPGVLALASALYGIVEAHTKAADATKLHKQATDELTLAENRLNDASILNDHNTRIGIQADIDAAKAKRELTKTTLDQARADLTRQKAKLQFDTELALRESQGEVGGGGGLLVGSDVSQIDAKLAEISTLRAEIGKSGGDIASGIAKLALRDVAGATDKATAATQRYEDAIAGLRLQFESGVFGDRESSSAKAQFTKLADAVTRSRDAELDAAKAAKQHHTASASLADAQAKLAAATTDVERAEAHLAIVRAQAKKDLDAHKITLGEYTARITDALKALDTAKLDIFSAGLRKMTVDMGDLTKELLKIQDFDTGKFDEIMGRDWRKPLDALGRENPLHDMAVADTQAAELAKRKAEDQIRDLADLYYDLFDGGTQRVWENFKRQGLRVIAEILARWTLANLFNGGGEGGTKDLGKIASSVIGSFFGHAGGGYAAPHSISRVNESGGGVELLRMGPQGGEIIPLGMTKASPRGGGTTIIHAPQFNLRGAIVTRELYADMQRISQANATQAATAAYEQSMRDAPAAVRRAGRFGD